MEQVWEARSFTWRCDSFWSGFTCMMQREVGEITGGEIQSVGQRGGSIGSSGSLPCAAAFHISGITGKGSGLQSDFHGPQVLLPSWALPDAKKYHDCLGTKMHVVQTGFIIIYSISLYSGFSSDVKINYFILRALWAQGLVPCVPSAEEGPGRASSWRMEAGPVPVCGGGDGVWTVGGPRDCG